MGGVDGGGAMLMLGDVEEDGGFDVLMCVFFFQMPTEICV